MIREIMKLILCNLGLYIPILDEMNLQLRFRLRDVVAKNYRFTRLRKKSLIRKIKILLLPV